MDTKDKTKKHKYTIGMRTLKTALAVFFCLLLTDLLGPSGVSIAAVSAIICMKETQFDSMITGSIRMIGTIIGGVLAYIYLFIYSILSNNFTEVLSYIDWIHYILIPIFVVVCIYLCNLFRIKEASTICSIVFIVIIIGYAYEGQRALITYVILRVVATVFGISIAMLINRFIAPYDKRKKIII